MKNTVLKYGMYGFIAAFVVFLSMLYFGQGLSFSIQEVLGFLSIFTALSFVYFGIRHHKNNELDGTIDFKTAFIVGALISICTAIGFGIVDAIYITQINPDFTEQYLTYQNSIIDAKTDLTPQEIKLEKLALLKQSEAYGSPGIVFLVMSMTVLVIGVIVSLLSALILHKKE